ncbi:MULTISPECIES: YcaO-like family protein [Rhizobium]|uniref:YcaO-like family protein n=1 Tax=Rhizobium sp. WYCCWR10014 TaxID=1825933 RepID=UPI000B17DD90|nr:MULTISPECIES: YcaO-like family protein [Rhizobium]
MLSDADTAEGLTPAPPAIDGRIADFRDELAAGLRQPLDTPADPGAAEACFRRLLPFSRRAGITRLADLTGLDRLGLPVAQAIQPAALSEVTSLGRGLTLMEAAVGAIMEGLERFFAERIPSSDCFLATADELRIDAALLENLLLPHAGTAWRSLPIPWTLAVDVASGAPQPVPLELVHTCYTDPEPQGDGLFIRTTTGLACHSTARDAFAHGLFECIERDAIARAFTTHGFFDRRRIATSHIGPKVEHILSVTRTQGIAFALWHAPSPTDLPVIWCQAIEAGAAEPTLALPTEGHSAGFTVETAAASAMLEALSARAGAISGARDDQTREHYRKSTDPLVADARRLILEATAAGTAASPFAPTCLRDVVDRVAACGLGPVLAVPVGADAEAGVACVRTILAGARPFSILR